MQYGSVLPGGGSPLTRKKSSPARVVAGHLFNKLRRPSRLRSRALVTLITITGILCLTYGRRNAAELQRTAITISTYIPTSITDVISQYGASFEDTRWDDDVELNTANNTMIKKPKFHLLIAAKSNSTNLCKTLLSAAILNYPPPTLISYGTVENNERPGMEVVKNTYSFLLGKEAHDEDLILIVEEDAWFQLPAQVTINRFFHGMQETSANLLDKYGRNGNDTTSDAPSYTQRVLFGAAKECSNDPSDPACYSVPQSPLPKDIYGFETDKHLEGMYNRPRFIASGMVIGHVLDLRPIYKHASEMLEFEEIGKQGSQYVFSQIFGEQEYARGIALASRPVAHPWRTWLEWAFTKNEHSTILPPNVTLTENKNYEFGIGLDYFSSIFQVMNNSADDIRFLKFDHPSIIVSPSKFAAASFKNPIHLPPDLSLAPAPYSQHVVSSPNPDPPVTALDDLKNGNSLWTDMDLATNVVVPGSSVPASLNFHDRESLLSELWAKMWYYPNARALLRQYIRSPDGPIAAEAAASGGDKWWDLRGGKGGVWTDRGEWLEWSEVCGAYDDEIFGDGKGEFGREPESVGGQKLVFNAFGEVVSGKFREGDREKVDDNSGLEVSSQELEKDKEVSETPNENLEGNLKGEKKEDENAEVEEAKMKELKEGEKTTELKSTTIEPKAAEITEAAIMSGSETKLPIEGGNETPIQTESGVPNGETQKEEVKIEVSPLSPEGDTTAPPKIETSQSAGGTNGDVLSDEHQSDTSLTTEEQNPESAENNSPPPDIIDEVSLDSPLQEGEPININTNAKEEVKEELPNLEFQIAQFEKGKANPETVNQSLGPTENTADAANAETQETVSNPELQLLAPGEQIGEAKGDDKAAEVKEQVIKPESQLPKPDDGATQEGADTKIEGTTNSPLLAIEDEAGKETGPAEVPGPKQETVKTEQTTEKIPETDHAADKVPEQPVKENDQTAIAEGKAPKEIPPAVVEEKVEKGIKMKQEGEDKEEGKKKGRDVDAKAAVPTLS